jgi:hypothetical protein
MEFVEFNSDTLGQEGAPALGPEPCLFYALSTSDPDEFRVTIRAWSLPLFILADADLSATTFDPTAELIRREPRDELLGENTAGSGLDSIAVGTGALADCESNIAAGAQSTAIGYGARGLDPALFHAGSIDV